MYRLILGIFSTVLLFTAVGAGAELRIAAWNLEHLNAQGDEGCISRTAEDYTVITESINQLDLDVVAFQEVKDKAAAHKVFPESEWNIEMSKRPEFGGTRECWDAPGRYLQHMATGFAIRKKIPYTRNDDVESLGLNQNSQRWGTDISLRDGSGIRLLSVHLSSGCWSSNEDDDESRESACTNLTQQMEIVKDWIEARVKEEVAFAILGDFNRRLAEKDDWAWRLLNSNENHLKLLTESHTASCDPRFDTFIDHIVIDSLATKLYQENSFQEGPRVAEHPDHCAVAADFEL